MKTLVLAMAMASTLLTPTTASAAVSPSAETRTERLADTRLDLAGERDQSRREVRQQRRGAGQAERRVDRSQTRGADRRVEQRQARRAERRRIGRVEQRQVTRQQRRAERRVDRRIADRRIERRVDRQVDRRIANRQADRRYDRRVDRRIDNRQYDPRYDRRGVVRADRQWNRQWRNNRRYNFNQYRRSNRQIFNPGRYYSPYRNRGYSRYNIGINIGRGFYGNRYWINDPYRYRLPPVYGGYRWIRYFNDALLIDTRSGVVADAVYGLFY